MVEAGKFDRADVFICPPDEDGGESAEHSGMKTKEVNINISLLFELSFNDFSSWTIAQGDFKRPCTIKASLVHFNTNLKVELV